MRAHSGCCSVFNSVIVHTLPLALPGVHSVNTSAGIGNYLSAETFRKSRGRARVKSGPVAIVRTCSCWPSKPSQRGNRFRVGRVSPWTLRQLQAKEFVLIRTNWDDSGFTLGE